MSKYILAIDHGTTSPLGRNNRRALRRMELNREDQGLFQGARAWLEFKRDKGDR